jgi:hypothetical protein
MDFTPASPSESVRLAKQNMTDNFSISGWAVLDEKQKGNNNRSEIYLQIFFLADSSTLSPWANILLVLEVPSMIKISQKQYTFMMHLVDELSLFLGVLERNKVQSRLIKQQLQQDSSTPNSPADDTKMTVCLFSPTTFTLAVIDGLEDAIINLSTPSPPPSLPEAELEPVMRDKSDSNIVIDLITTSAPIVASTAKIEPSSPPSINIIRENSPTNGNLSKGFNLFGQKKSKIEETIQRGLDISSKVSRASSQTSLVTMSDNGDDTLSQWDQLSEDLDTEFDPVLLNNEFEQQQEKAARIELDEDSVSLTEKNNANKMIIGTNALESVCLFFNKETNFIHFL